MSTHRALMMGGKEGEIILLPYVILNGDYIKLGKFDASARFGCIVKDYDTTSGTFWMGRRYAGLGVYSEKYATGSDYISDVSVSNNFVNIEINDFKCYLNDVQIVRVNSLISGDIYIGCIESSSGNVTGKRNGYIKKAWVSDSNNKLDLYPCYDVKAEKYGFYNYISGKVYYFVLGLAYYDGDLNSLAYTSEIVKTKRYVPVPYVHMSNNTSKIYESISDIEIDIDGFDNTAGEKMLCGAGKVMIGTYYADKIGIGNKFEMTYDDTMSRHTYKRDSDGKFYIDGQYTDIQRVSTGGAHFVIGALGESSTITKYMSEYNLYSIKLKGTNDYDLRPVLDSQTNKYKLINVLDTNFVLDLSGKCTYNWI